MRALGFLALLILGHAPVTAQGARPVPRRLVAPRADIFGAWRGPVATAQGGDWYFRAPVLTNYGAPFSEVWIGTRQRAGRPEQRALWIADCSDSTIALVQVDDRPVAPEDAAWIRVTPRTVSELVFQVACMVLEIREAGPRRL